MSGRIAVRTHQGLRVAEGLGSGCAWSVCAGLPLALGLCGGGAWIGAGVAVALVGGLLLRALARARAERARPLLEGMGTQVLPTAWSPLAIPMGVSGEGRGRVVRRVHAVRVPDGRRVTAEVAVDRSTGAFFAAWPATLPRPAAARNMDITPSVILGGVHVALVDPEPRLHDERVRRALREALPPDGEVAVYPFSLWWRVRGPVDGARLEEAARRLSRLADALGAD